MRQLFSHIGHIECSTRGVEITHAQQIERGPERAKQKIAKGGKQGFPPGDAHETITRDSRDLQKDEQIEQVPGKGNAGQRRNKQQDQDIEMHDTAAQISWSGRSGKNQREQPQDAQRHQDDTGQTVGDPLDAQGRRPPAKGIPHFSVLNDAVEIQYGDHDHRRQHGEGDGATPFPMLQAHHRHRNRGEQREKEQDGRQVVIHWSFFRISSSSRVPYFR